MVRKSALIILSLIILAACQPQKSTSIENHDSKLLPLLVQPEDIHSNNKWKSILVSQKTISPPHDGEVEEAFTILDGFSADKHPLYVEHGLSCYQDLITLADVSFHDDGTLEPFEIGQESVSSCNETPIRDSRILSCTLRVRYNNLISHIIVRLDIPQSETYSKSHLMDLIKELGLLIDNRLSNGEFCVD